MADFTGGEWVKDGMTIRAKNGAGTIATIPSPKNGGVFKCQANAHLMAAAPDMYASLKEFVAINERDGYELDSNEPGLYERILGALAKADGTTPTPTEPQS